MSLVLCGFYLYFLCVDGVFDIDAGTSFFTCLVIVVEMVSSYVWWHSLLSVLVEVRLTYSDDTGFFWGVVDDRTKSVHFTL